MGFSKLSALRELPYLLKVSYVVLVPHPVKRYSSPSSVLVYCLKYVYVTSCFDPICFRLLVSSLLNSSLRHTESCNVCLYHQL